MDKDLIRNISIRLTDTLQALETATSEEATKMGLIVPMIHGLGYNPYDLREVIPEFSADVGNKRGERVDYAIIRDDQPVMLIEAKPAGEPLKEDNVGQLSRYFGTLPELHIAILTNGVSWKFFADLDKPNVMDSHPFFEVDLMNLSDADLDELERFSKKGLNIGQLLETATGLKHTRAIKALLTKQMTDPDEGLVRWVTGEVYDGVRSTTVIEKFTALTKEALQQVINDRVYGRLQHALQGEEPPRAPSTGETAPTNGKTTAKEEEPEDSITTTVEELETYCIIKSMLHDLIPPERVVYKDFRQQMSIYLRRSETDRQGIRVAVLFFHKAKKEFAFTEVGEPNPKRRPIANPDEMYQYRDELRELTRQALEPKPANAKETQAEAAPPIDVMPTGSYAGDMARPVTDQVEE